MSVIAVGLFGAIVVALWVALSDDGDAPTLADEAEYERPFDSADFKWPVLLEHLNGDTLLAASTTDEAAFILYYFKEMNEVFGDPEMKVFIDAQCFTRVYDAETNARLQAVFWTKVIPTAVAELGSILSTDSAAGVFASRYPIVADAWQGISRDLPEGTLDRLFILGNLPTILSEKAKQDALTLFTEYGCGSDVTRRVYSNAVEFVKTYDLASR